MKACFKYVQLFVDKVDEKFEIEPSGKELKQNRKLSAAPAFGNKINTDPIIMVPSFLSNCD